MNAEERFFINASSISQNLVSFNLDSISRSYVIEAIGFSKMKKHFYCLFVNETELKIIKINHFLQNATVIARLPQDYRLFCNQIGKSSMDHEKDLIGVIQISGETSGNITSFYGHICIFHVESGTLEEFIINRAKLMAPVQPVFCGSSWCFAPDISAWFHLENKGWLMIAHNAKVYIADTDHTTKEVSWKYLTVVPREQCGVINYHYTSSSTLAIKEKFFCSFEKCNNVAIYDGRNNVWSVTQIEPDCLSSLFVSPFKLQSSKLVCFSAEPMFVSRDGNIFPLHISLEDEFHHLPITCLFDQECKEFQIFQHLVRGMILIIGYDNFGCIKTLDVFYNNVQSLQDLAFKTLSMYYYSSFKCTSETFKSMLNLPCSLNRRYF